jgi:hypothetical protein
MLPDACLPPALPVGRAGRKAKTLSDWRSPVRLTSARRAGRRDKLIYFIDRVIKRYFIYSLWSLKYL